MTFKKSQVNVMRLFCISTAPRDLTHLPHEIAGYGRFPASDRGIRW